jgi:hypothetical protein
MLLLLIIISTKLKFTNKLVVRESLLTKAYDNCQFTKNRNQIGIPIIINSEDKTRQFCQSHRRKNYKPVEPPFAGAGGSLQ